MTETQEVRTVAAARLAGMKTGRFLYYIAKGRCPPFEERAGIRFFRTEDVINWKPTLLKRGPKSKTTHAPK